MKSVTFAEAQAKFESVFDMAIGGELVVVARNQQRVAVHLLGASNEPEVAPPGYFEDDYSADDVGELNALASRGPQTPIP
jgi:hypothetical protein